MSQDIIADTLNKIMNAKRSNKRSVSVKHRSKLLISLLALAKLKGYIKEYNLEENELKIEIGKLNACGAIKPRFIISVEEIEIFTKRYLPSKNIGTLILTTDKGLMAHQTAEEKNIGGSLLAYFY